MSEFEEEMEQFDDEWEAVEPGQSRGLLPDGIYQARVAISRVEKTSWDAWQWSMLFVDTNEQGEVWLNFNLDHEEGRKYAKKTAAMMGFEGKGSALQQACEQGVFDDLVCDIKVVTKAGAERDYTNVYVRRVHGKAEPVMAGESDEDIPF